MSFSLQIPLAKTESSLAIMQMPQMLAYPQRSSPRKKSIKWHGALPVSAIEKVLLQDNKLADSLLTEQLKRIRTDRYRAGRLLDLQEQSFILRQAIKETELREMGIAHTSFLPEIVMKMTEPDVRARRPFSRTRRSATEVDLKGNKGSKSLVPFLNDRQTVETNPFLDEANNRHIFTRLNGIDLPLYGPRVESKRKKRERQQTKAKAILDPRFRKLEQALVRDETNVLAELPRINKKPREIVLGNDDDRDARRDHTSDRVLHKMQQELSKKPTSVFAKSAWVDFS